MARQLLRRISGDIDEALIKKPKEFQFIDPPLINAPFTQITKLDGSPRKLPDPSLTLKPAFGIERLIVNNLEISVDEKGPNGEVVKEADTKDTRMRWVGSTFFVSIGNSGPIITTDGNFTSSSDFFEITFYGTGLNINGFSRGSATLNGDVYVDGSSVGLINMNPATSAVINGRQYRANVVTKIVSGLALGVHTVRIQGDAGNTTSWLFYGCEILNEDTQIQIPQGDIFSGGKKFTNPSLTALDYNSGFDGSPVLNGRGGRVVEYITRTGTLGKVLQQVDATALTHDNADHSNEELIRRIDWKEFGANRGDDFSTLSGAGATDRAFTLDDGTTTLVGNDVDNPSGNLLRFPGIGSFVTLTFVGTGLDLELDHNGGDDNEIFVDGASIGLQDVGGSGAKVTKRVISGLPYGTHTVKIERVDNSFGSNQITGFLVYGPKKPTIPEDAVKIGEYYLMADFDGSTAVAETSNGKFEVPQGTLFKDPLREYVYEGASWTVGGPFVDSLGFSTFADNSGDKYSYTFFGTGFSLWLRQNGGTSHTFTTRIDGILTDGTIRTPGTVSNTGTGAYSMPTGNAPARIEFTGLSLGIHTIEIEKTNTTNDMPVEGGFVITPVHFPNTKIGSLSMGPGAQLHKETSTGGVDLGKAKAWILYNMDTEEIVDSYNIAAVVNVSTGFFRVYFERPFKTRGRSGVAESPVGVASASSNRLVYVEHNAGAVGGTRYDGALIQVDGDTTQTVTTSARVSAVFYGELEDEGDKR